VNRPAVTAAVAVCRVVLGEVRGAIDNALDAAEVWSEGEEPTTEDYCAIYARLGKDARSEAVYWVLTAAYEAEEKESAYCLLQCLATLATLSGWDDESVQALHASLLAPRDTIPAPAPEFQEAA
jgi:hypothetical protein